MYSYICCFLKKTNLGKWFWWLHVCLVGGVKRGKTAGRANKYELPGPLLWGLLRGSTFKHQKVSAAPAAVRVMVVFHIVRPSSIHLFCFPDLPRTIFRV